MSYFVFAERLAVTNGVEQVTQPCPMDGNAIRFGLFLYALGGATGIVIQPQGSNDGANWANLTASSTLSSTFNVFESTGISYAMVRARLATQGTGTVALALDGNTAHL